MKYCVIGAGAMGLRYGIQLMENAGCDVEFIDCWKDNVEKIREQGYEAVRHEFLTNEVHPAETAHAFREAQKAGK